MKTLGEIDRNKDNATAKASDVARQLSFAGLAVIWILREDSGNPISAPLLAPLILFVLSLALDLLQYVWCSVIWTAFYIHKDGIHRSDDVRVDIPPWINRPTYACFYLKLLALLTGWTWLAFALINQWKPFV